MEKISKQRIVTSIGFQKEQYNQLKNLAEFEGLSVSTFMRKAILEYMEDIEDYKDAVIAENESDGTYYTADEVEKMLGIK